MFSGRGRLHIMTWKDISSVFFLTVQWYFSFCKRKCWVLRKCEGNCSSSGPISHFCFNCISLYHFPSSLVILTSFFFLSTLALTGFKLFWELCSCPSCSILSYPNFSSSHFPLRLFLSSPSHPLFFLTEMNPSHPHTNLLPPPLPLHTNPLFIDFYLSSHPSFPSFRAFRVNDTDRCSLHPFSKLSYTINSSCIWPSTSSSSLSVSGTHTHTRSYTTSHKNTPDTHCAPLYPWTKLLKGRQIHKGQQNTSLISNSFTKDYLLLLQRRIYVWTEMHLWWFVCMF